MTGKCRLHHSANEDVTHEGRFHLKSKQRKVIYQTREGVFHLISKHEEECFIRYPNTEKWYIKHEKECFIWYPNTRKSVLFDIQTPRSDISNTRRNVSFDIQTPRSNKSNTRRSVHPIFKHREVVLIWPFSQMVTTISWLTNYVCKRWCLTCLSWIYRIDQDLHSLKSSEFKFGSSLEFSEFFGKIPVRIVLDVMFRV